MGWFGFVGGDRGREGIIVFFSFESFYFVDECAFFSGGDLL